VGPGQRRYRQWMLLWYVHAALGLIAVGVGLILSFVSYGLGAIFELVVFGAFLLSLRWHTRKTDALARACIEAGECPSCEGRIGLVGESTVACPECVRHFRTDGRSASRKRINTPRNEQNARDA